MSIQSTNQALLRNLVETLVEDKSKNKPKEIQLWAEKALKITKSHTYARTNQFEVDRQLRGLVEKFQVLNRDDLANGLNHSLDRLSKVETKWTPDILDLLLHLSDQPAKKAAFYEAKSPGEVETTEHLNWNQLLADDPISDDDLWLNQTYSPISSDSELESDELESLPENVPKEEVEVATLAPTHYLELDDHLLRQLQSLQFWSTSSKESDAISDLSIIRELILMIRCLPTILFNIDGDGNVSFNTAYRADSLSETLLNSVMKDVAIAGTKLRHLHSYLEKPTQDHSLQRFKAIISNRLHTLTKQLNELETGFTTNPTEKVVSLSQVVQILKKWTHPLLEIDIIVSKLDYATSTFSHLEALYDVTCYHQSVGDDALYHYFAEIFVNCFEIYLRSIQLWMQEGQISNTDTSFFISKNDSALMDASIWHDLYFIRNHEDGTTFSPKFIQPAVEKILNAGKSIVFLEKLGIKTRTFTKYQNNVDFGKLVDQKLTDSLSQFGIIFSDAFAQWMGYQTSALKYLRAQLVEQHGLMRTLKALREIYFASDGSMFQALADPIFEALDSRSQAWNDHYILVERLRDLLSNSKHVETNRISIRISPHKSNSKTLQALSTILIDYNLSWPLLNIVRQSTLSSYQKVFRLLLQIYRVKYQLRNTLFMRGNAPLTHVEISIRQDLQCFTDILQSHMINAVLIPTSERLDARMDRATDLDEMTAVHDEAIQSIQTQCLLTKNLAPISHAIISVLDLGVRFSELRQQIISKQRTVPKMQNITYRKHGRSKSSIKITRARKPISPSSSEGEEEGGSGAIDYDADTEKLSGNEGTHSQRLEKIQEEATRLRNFIVTGLKGISRTGGEQSWEMLAEQLDWSRKS